MAPRLPRVPNIKPKPKPVKPPVSRVQPGGPKPSVPSKPKPKPPVVQPPSGSSILPSVGIAAAGASVGFLPNLINGATQVGTTAVLADTFKEVSEYLVDNPWSLAIIGGVVLLVVLR